MINWTLILKTYYLKEVQEMLILKWQELWVGNREDKVSQQNSIW